MNQALVNYHKILAGESQPRFRSADLKLKTEEAFKLLEECELCSRECRVDRISSKKGYCRVGNKLSVSSCFDHLGEEYFFVPSFTIFFSQC